jgi:homopolymeric O-antigen transport system permease protein
MTVPATRDAGLVRPSPSSRVHIRHRRGYVFPDLREFWRYRDLLYILAWRDIKVRYAQTVLGVSWTLIQPIALTLVFTYGFHRLGNIETEGVPYTVFALTGVIFWTFFSRAVTQGSDSLVENAALVTKIYCPRMLIPIASIVSALVDLALSLVLVLVVTSFYGYYPTWRYVLLVPVVLVGLAFAAALTSLLAAINVRYRDVRYGIPFFVMLWLFISPVAYPIENPVAALNPLVGIIDAFRWCLVGTPVTAWSLGLALAATIGTIIVGTGYFMRAERTLADVA